MTTITIPSSLALVPSLESGWQEVDNSFERFCLTAGIGAIEQMLCEDAQQFAGARHSRSGGRVGYRWGRTKGKIGFHGGKVAVHRPRVRSLGGHEVALPTWPAAQAEDWLGRWAMNLMLINVSTRKLRRAVRLPERVICRSSPGTAPRSRRPRAGSSRCPPSGWPNGWHRICSSWTSSSSRSTGCTSATTWCLSPRSASMGTATNIRSGLVEGATENPAVVQALIDNLIERGLDPTVCRLFIIDGAKAEQSHPSHLRRPHADPALSDPQSTQRDRAAAQAAACVGTPGAPAGLGT